jgi:hypothetical protein
MIIFELVARFFIPMIALLALVAAAVVIPWAWIGLLVALVAFLLDADTFALSAFAAWFVCLVICVSEMKR